MNTTHLISSIFILLVSSFSFAGGNFDYNLKLECKIESFGIGFENNSVKSFEKSKSFTLDLLPKLLDPGHSGNLAVWSTEGEFYHSISTDFGSYKLTSNSEVSIPDKTLRGQSETEPHMNQTITLYRDRPDDSKQILGSAVSTDILPDNLNFSGKFPVRKIRIINTLYKEVQLNNSEVSIVELMKRGLLNKNQPTLTSAELNCFLIKP